MNNEISPMLKELLSYCEEGKSGTFFVTGKDNKTCQVVIENGAITKCLYSQMGIDAIPVLKAMDIDTFSFSPEVILPMKEAANISSSDAAMTLLQEEHVEQPAPVAKSAPKKRKLFGSYRGQPIYKDTGE